MMKKNVLIYLLLIFLITPSAVFGAVKTSNRLGAILLQVEKNGEAWYVFPPTGARFFLGRPADAFAVMKKLALGVKHQLISGTDVFPARLSGMILLDTERNGEAFYINPEDNKKYYLGRPDDAYRIMREFGQGISDAGLMGISVGQTGDGAIAALTTSLILQNVPFTSQAPFAEWSDLRQEDGCEEAASLMAVSWAREQILTKSDSLKQITGSSDYVLKKYGEYRDLSVDDTLAWVIKDFFDYKNAVVKNNISLSDIINELERGRVVIAPMDGQALNNPNYTPPGPKHHMLIIIGYDPVRKIFVTNDPGTRKGKSYEYDRQILYNAIRAYPTGFQEPDVKTEKNVIIVWKQ